jgi:hypothetical protein
MPYTPKGKKTMLKSLTAGSTLYHITHVSLHSSAPTTAGSNELSTAGNIYARLAITFGSTATGKYFDSSSIQFTVPAGSTVYAVGFWSASAAGQFLAYTTVTSEAFVGQGNYTLTGSTLDLNAV